MRRIVVSMWTTLDGYAQRLDSMPKFVVSRHGSLSVIAALRAVDMIDEYHLLVHPTTIGTGKALFPADQTPARLRLRSVEPFPSGVALMRYSPASETTDDDR
jgi:hypothetical protein